MTSVTKNHISPFFQIAVFLIAAIPLLFFIWATLSRFHAHDARPGLISYEQGAPFANTVKMGLFITDFATFDIAKNKIIFNGIVWAEFDPNKATLATVSDFSFDKGVILKRGKPIIEERGALTFVRWPVRVKLRINFNYRAFPLDNHQLFIELTNHELNATDMRLVGDKSGFSLSSSAELSNWKIANKHVEDGYVCVNLQEQSVEKKICIPRIIFTIDFRKFDLRHLFSILLPLLLIFLLTLFSFSFDVEKFYDTLISISIGGITALLAYRFVIESLTPDVGYFILSDYLFILFLIAVFLVFFFNTTIMHLSQRTKKILICLLHAFVIGGCGLLFYWTLGI